MAKDTLLLSIVIQLSTGAISNPSCGTIQPHPRKARLIFSKNPMFLEFAIQNWYLFAMLAVILLLLAFDPANKMAGGASKISATQLPQIQARKSAVVVDVRNEEEFKKGHIEQSINLPLDSLEGNLKKLNKHRGKPVILICQSGTRAAKAAGILKNNEFGELYALEGGIASWSKENLPLARS